MFRKRISEQSPDDFDGGTFDFYYDGNLVSSERTTNIAMNLDPNNGGWRVLGLDPTRLVKFSDLQLLPYALDAQTVYDFYHSEQAQGCNPVLNVDGLFDKRKVSAVGEVSRIEYVSANIDGEFYNNAGVISFSLYEV